MADNLSVHLFLSLHPGNATAATVMLGLTGFQLPMATMASFTLPQSLSELKTPQVKTMVYVSLFWMLGVVCYKCSVAQVSVQMSIFWLVQKHFEDKQAERPSYLVSNILLILLQT